MKIAKDFGVRGLLAVIAAVGYYVPLIYVVIKIALSTETIVSLLAAASSPWLLAMGFYFGSHIAAKQSQADQTNGQTTSRGTSATQ
jgi:hypothetical protein